MNQPPEIINCPNCGAQRPAGISYCSNCGYGTPSGQFAPRRQTPVLWIILFIVIGLPSGCLGGCFLMMGGESSISDPAFLLFGLGGIAVFIALLVMLIKKAKS